ncbi:S49 family peptidase [Aliamphritea hakodatensis]|uniref:S49 family peptidase n=1 Tax=Aliamphritea hakodatensis TaxID=2895352 RepID=UPI0022FD41FE|nr:S49 family peptidase [Aliamphritea hakodatensis]
MQNMAHVASRVLNTPLLLEPGYARTFFSALAPRLNILELQDDSGVILTGEKMRQSAAAWSGGRQRAGTVTRTRPGVFGEPELIYHIVDGVAIISVQGTLVHKFGYLNPTSGMTGYDSIIERAGLALADHEVKGVLLDNETPGGEVSGCFNTSRKLREMADAVGKPLWALCYDMNCSAGMALASAAHHRLINETGIAGSVGVVMAHADLSAKLEADGVRVTLIHSGAHKVDGNPYEALGAEVTARFQSESDVLRNEFAELVAGHMGLSVAEVLATEAATFRGQAAVDVGFADEVVNGIDAVSVFSEHLSSQGRVISIGASMSKGDKATQAEVPGGNGPAAAEQLPAAGADAGAVADQSAAMDKPDAAADMQKRIAGILDCEEAVGREATAKHLAFNTSMSVEEAKGVLATVDVGGAGAEASEMGNALEAAMSAEPQPGIVADAQADAGGKGSQGSSLLASYERVTGDK